MFKNLLKTSICFLLVAPSLNGQKKELCSSLSAAEFKLRFKKPSFERILFFSSWCSACQKHLQDFSIKKEQQQKTLLLGVFDERVRIESVIKSMKLDKWTCVHDKDGSLKDLFKVSSVPKIIDSQKAFGIYVDKGQ